MEKQLLECMDALNENLEKNNKLLAEIRNLIESHPAIDKFAEALHELSSSIGQIKKSAHNDIEQNGHKKNLPMLDWRCETLENDEKRFYCIKPNSGKSLKCESCGSEVMWGMTKKGKKMVVAPDPQRPSEWQAHMDCFFKNKPKKQTTPQDSNDDGDIPF